MLLLKKVCMIGSFAVGKTSLVRRFVEGFFSDEYQTNIGVKLSNKEVSSGGREIKMTLWDIYGEDDFQKMRWSYVQGSSGYLLVADGTRAATLHKAEELEAKLRQEVGVIPFVFLINKSDRKEEWELNAEFEQGLVARGWDVLHTSAKSGEGVEAAFAKLTEKMLA
jgi:small GTP-binding protein